MPNNLLAWIPTVSTLLATYLLHSTLLMAGTWLVLRLIRSANHTLTERLWKFAAVSGLLTASVQLSFGFADPVLRFHVTDSTSSDKAASSAVVSVSDGSVAEFAAERDEQFLTDSPLHARAHVVSLRGRNAVGSLDSFGANIESSGANVEPKPFEGDDVMSQHSSSNNPASPFMVAFGACGFLFIVISVFRLMSESLMFHWRAARCNPLDGGPARQLLDEIMQQVGVRRDVQLLDSNTYTEPVAFGLVHWRIVLPIGIENRLTPAELRALLAHELAHLVRGDTIWLWIGRVLCSCLAFQPCNFVARAAWRRAAEFQCDDWAVRHAVDPLTLARSLTLVAEWRLNSRVCAATLAASGQRSHLTDRVERLLHNECGDDRWGRGLQGSRLAVVALVLLTPLTIWGPKIELLAQQTEARDNSAAIDQPRISAAVKHRDHQQASYVPAPIAEQLDALRGEIELLQDDIELLNRALDQPRAGLDARRRADQFNRKIESLTQQRDKLIALLEAAASPTNHPSPNE